MGLKLGPGKSYRPAYTELQQNRDRLASFSEELLRFMMVVAFPGELRLEITQLEVVLSERPQLKELRLEMILERVQLEIVLSEGL
jgi:hypothetical protein